MDEDNVSLCVCVCVCVCVCNPRKENEIMSFTGKLIELEVTFMLSKISQGQ
jgi:hypothetical protein